MSQNFLLLLLSSASPRRPRLRSSGTAAAISDVSDPPPNRAVEASDSGVGPTHLGLHSEKVLVSSESLERAMLAERKGAANKC